MKRLQNDFAYVAYDDGSISVVTPGGIETTWHLTADGTSERGTGSAVIGGETAAAASVTYAAVPAASEIPTDSWDSLNEVATNSSVLAWAKGSLSDLQPDQLQWTITDHLVDHNVLDSGDETAQPNGGTTKTTVVWPTGYEASINAQAAATGLPVTPSGDWISTPTARPNSLVVQPPPGVDIGRPPHAANPATAGDPPTSTHSAESNAVEHSPSASTASGVNITNVITNADGSISEIVSFAGSGIVFNNTFDAGVTQAYQNCAVTAERAIASEWSNSVTINEQFVAQAQGQNGELASNNFQLFSVTYAILKSALSTLASHEPADTYLLQAVAHLPSADPSGGAGFELAMPYARMLGLTSASDNPDDILTLNTSYNWTYAQDVVNTLEHEISEGGMGRIGGLGDQNGLWSVMDLFRYNSSRELDETDGRDGRTTFFSYNGGSTLSSLSFRNEYDSLGVQVNNGDTADFIQQDVFGTGNPGETNTLSQTDIQVMETLGWITPSPGPVVSASNVTLSAGQTSVAASSLFIAADRNGDSNTGYAVKDTGPGYFVLSGVTEANNQEIDVAATQLSQLIYQSAPGAVDQLQIRAEDAQAWGSWVSFTVVAPPLLIQTDTNAYGSTSLAELGNNYFLYAAGTTAGPELRYAGAAVIASGRIPIGAVEIASGYEVAWKLPSINEYALWTVDSKGNFLSGSGALAGNSFKLESAETTFNQDLNGDRVIGLNPIVIQTDTNAYGSTSLAELGNNYFLDAAGTTAGPELRYAGAAVIAGGRSIPIGAVETASGYEVAWKLPSVNEYALWTVDSKGNFLSGSGALARNSFKLESAETTFNQDLNGDGVIGLNPIVIQTDTNAYGSTSLAELGNNYFLYAAGTTAGPELRYAGAAVIAGGRIPIGAIETASGYEVAWKLPSVNQYALWTVDSKGNFLSGSGALAGNSFKLESAETTFNQDLNGDGVIGLNPIVIQTDTNAYGSTSLAELGNNYFLYAAGTTAGPELRYAGAAVIAGGRIPIGAVETASGYEVAWKSPSVNEYALWTVDSKGNFLSGSGALAGNSFKLESAETTFNQDLNGDGVIGATPTAPVVSQQTSNQTWGVGTAIYFTLPANTFTDPQHENLTYSATLVGEGQLPSWLGFNGITGTFTGTVPNGTSGLNISVTATDTSGLSASETFSVVTPASAPVVSQQTSNQTWGVGTAIDFALPANTFTDPQHENLTYSATLVGGGQLPSWLGFNGITGTFTGVVPNGTSGLNIRVTATDTSGLSASDTFSVATPASAPIGISPMRASDFLSTLGVVTHIPYTDGGYVILGNVVADLHYLGINQIRDSLSDGSNGSAPLSSDIYLAQQGIKFTTIVETSTTAGLNYALSLIDQVNEAVPGSITAVEGPNEINNFPLTFNGVSGLQGAIDLQKALYADVHSDPHLAGVPVDYFTGYDAGSIGAGPNPYTTAGLADYDTQHPYPTYGQAPAWFVNPSNALPNEGPVYGPAVYTETGYSTIGGSSGGLVPVNQDVQAKYALDLLMDAAKDGISKTYLYQLMDAYQPGSPQGDDGFGLFDPNNAPKEAATAIHNLTTILADNGAGSKSFATTPLNYSVTGLPSTGNNTLMEKSNGAYDIVVWNEPQIWNESTGTEITAPTMNVTVQLGNTYSDVEVFDPLVSSTPIQTLTHVSSVQLAITDHPLIVEIEPAPIVTAQSAGASGTATIGVGATLELTAADSATVTFKASTGMLKLDNPSTFTGEIFNFTGNGSLSGSDQIDLRTINYNSVHNSYGTGVLTVTDGTNIANLHFSGAYTLANFKFASDGSGGTIVYDPPVLNSPTAGTRIVTADRRNDAFLFHTNLSQTASTEHTFRTDTVHVDQAEFAWASLAIVHDAHEDVIFPNALHDMHNNALAQQHHSGFLI